MSVKLRLKISMLWFFLRFRKFDVYIISCTGCTLGVDATLLDVLFLGHFWPHWCELCFGARCVIFKNWLGPEAKPTYQAKFVRSHDTFGVSKKSVQSLGMRFKAIFGAIKNVKSGIYEAFSGAKRKYLRRLKRTMEPFFSIWNVALLDSYLGLVHK